MKLDLRNDISRSSNHSLRGTSAFRRSVNQPLRRWVFAGRCRELHSSIRFDRRDEICNPQRSLAHPPDAARTLLAARGAARPVLEEEDVEPAPANLNDALAEWRNGFPDQIPQTVGRAACVVKAAELVRPSLPFPELLDQENALRKSLAESQLSVPKASHETTNIATAVTLATGRDQRNRKQQPVLALVRQ
jgi:hypothetical protein